MTTLYVVLMTHRYEGPATVVAAFSTREKAESCAARQDAADPDEDHFYEVCETDLDAGGK